MNQFEQWFDQDLTQQITVRHRESIMFSADNDATVIGVRLFKDGEPATPGSSCTCTVIRSDGGSVSFAGSVSGNEVSAVIPQAALVIPGPIAVMLQTTDGTSTMTVLKAVFTCEPSTTGTIIDPGTIIPSVTDLIADIEAAVESIPADYTELLAAIAPTFSSSTAYAAGAYVWYGGTLYRFTSAHAAGSWTGTDATAVALASDVSDLKSAIKVLEPTASSADIGKFLKAKNVNNGKVSEYELSSVENGQTVPTNVRAAIVTLFTKAAYTETGLDDEVAILQSWATEYTAITLNQSVVSISGTGTFQLVAATTPVGGVVTWTSSDSAVASVNSSGLVTGSSNGTATITATCGNVSAQCAVTVSGFAILTSIDATYTQSGTVYEGAPLSDLVSDLVVVAHYDDSSTVTLTSDQYNLSGTLAVGTSVITVSFGGKTDTFSVTVSAVPVLVSITAVYTQGIVYATDAVSDLKNSLVVTAVYDDTSTATVDANDYTLSGTLATGTSVITVSYQSKTTTFNVIVYGFEPQLCKTIAGGSGVTAKISANNSRCVNIGTNGTNQIQNNDGTASGLYPVPIRSGVTKIHVDMGSNIISTLQVLKWDSANSIWIKQFGGEWADTSNEYSLTAYNDGTYYCAIIAAKSTGSSVPQPDSTFDFTGYTFSTYEIYFD